MQYYREVLTEERRYAQRLIWQEDKKYLRANLENLKETAERLQVIVHELNELTVVIQFNMDNAHALRNDINAAQLGLSPISVETIRFVHTEKDGN